MAKFCDKCGHELKNENVKFCDKCGAELTVTNNQSNSTMNMHGGSLICPHCGQPTPMGQPVCANCGLSLEENTAAVIVGYIVTILFSILGLIPGIYLVTRNNKKSKIQGINIIVFALLIPICTYIFAAYICIILWIIFIAVGLVLWYTDIDINL